MSTVTSERLAALLEAVERMAGGDFDHRIPLSEHQDEADALAHAINVLVGELQIVTAGLRRAKEEAEAASLAKTVFLRNVSHEIRTPLTVVLGMSELIASRHLPRHRIEELQQRIAANGRALVGILDDLLDLAKVEAERLEFYLEPILMASVVAEVIASFETEATRKGLALVLESDTAGGQQAIGDAKRLRQVLMNMVGNAIKFTERGQVALRISKLRDSRHVAVDIADTGIGMTRAQARMLFEPFMQADATIARRYGGSGLGLAISKRLAEGMGGTLDVIACAPGVGTTFRISLPMAEAELLSAAPHEEEELEPPGTELQNWRILVVEDHDDVRATNVELLRRAGAIVTEAADGQDAIDAATANVSLFDAILMDVRMPRVDGIEATRRLRASGVVVPIIALTADAVAEQRTECLSAGCTAYLAKPLDVDQLVVLLGERAS